MTVSPRSPCPGGAAQRQRADTNQLPHNRTMKLHHDRSPLPPASAVPANCPPAVVAPLAAVVPVAPPVAGALDLTTASARRAVALVGVLPREVRTRVTARRSTRDDQHRHGRPVPQPSHDSLPAAPGVAISEGLPRLRNLGRTGRCTRRPLSRRRITRDRP